MAPTLGQTASWPINNAPRAFVYLHNFSGVGRLLKALAAAPISALVFTQNIGEQLLCQSANIKYVSTPLSMQQMLEECDVAINLGNFATAAELLLHGKPQLLITDTLERYMVGRRFLELGAVVLVTEFRDTDWQAEIEKLMQPKLAQAARAFAKAYQQRYTVDANDLLYEQLSTQLIA